MLTEYNNDPDLWENEVACKNCTPAALSSTTPHPHHRVTASPRLQPARIIAPPDSVSDIFQITIRKA